MSYTPDQYETDFDRWLDSLTPAQREQITRDIEAARDLIDRECYVPTTEEARSMYGGSQYEPEFDRWLAAHDAEVRTQALNEAVASLRAKFGPTNRAADYLARAEQTKEDR